MSIDLLSNEHIIKEGCANFFRGIEGVGGKLFFSTHKLFSSSHA